MALVTGGSRGVGAATCLELARAGFDVVLTYRNKAARGEDVAAALRTLGARALAVPSDLTSATDRDALEEQVGSWAGTLQALVLNASGGLERDLCAADPGYPMRVNRDAQVAVVEALLPRLEAGAVVVHVTSHWAHLHGLIEQLPHYEPVAASKRAGELALRAMKPRLAARDVRLAVVTGDLVEGTITARLLERRAGGLTEQRRQEAGNLPTVEDMARAIVGACLGAAEGADPVVVGGPLEALLPLGG